MNKRTSYFPGKLAVRAENDEMRIEGYFAVFNQETKIWDGYFEKIAPGAFDNSLKNNDIRCLFNHDTGIVLGRTAAGTLELRVDSHGLWGSVKINPNDSAARDIYERVKRGDISGCSFGFDPIRESVTDGIDGNHWTVEEADTVEISVCTFPAYPQTEITARMEDLARAEKQEREHRRKALKLRLEALKNGNKKTDS